MTAVLVQSSFYVVWDALEKGVQYEECILILTFSNGEC
jgi:hypothetical protein